MYSFLSITAVWWPYRLQKLWSGSAAWASVLGTRSNRRRIEQVEYKRAIMSETTIKIERHKEKKALSWAYGLNKAWELNPVQWLDISMWRGQPSFIKVVQPKPKPASISSSKPQIHPHLVPNGLSKRTEQRMVPWVDTSAAGKWAYIVSVLSLSCLIENKEGMIAGLTTCTQSLVLHRYMNL